MQERTEPPSVDNLTAARRAIEAMLLVANDPTPVQLLAQLVELPVDLVQSMCRELAGEYEAERRGFQLVEVAGGWRYQTHPDTHAYVERFALEGIPNRLSSAALETLAIVAYKQPISRAQIGAIRGVNVDGVLRTLVQRGYVDEQGRDDGPGQATLFGTTSFFLEQLGLMSLDDLPPLGDFVPSVEVLEALENTLRVDPEPGADVAIVDDEPSAGGSGEPDREGATPPAGVANGASSRFPAGRGDLNGDSASGVAVEPVEGGADDEAVFEVIGDPGRSVISLDTEPAPIQPDATDQREPGPGGVPVDDVEPTSATETMEAADQGPPPGATGRVEPESAASDELEVAADPEVERTDGATATDAAGVDDARFPGPGPAPPTDPADRLAADQGPGGDLGRRPAPAPRPEGSEPLAPGPGTLSNGQRANATSAHNGNNGTA